MLSDIENLDIMLGERHSEREESVNSKSARRPESAISNMYENNEENLYLNHRELGLGNDADQGQNSTSDNSNAELIRDCFLDNQQEQAYDTYFSLKLY